MDAIQIIKNKFLKGKKENLFLILILLIILLFSFNYIFSDSSIDKLKKAESNKEEILEKNESKTTLEEKISNILSQINGVSEASVIINYIDNGENEYVFNTKEEYLENGKLNSQEKNIVYNEENGEKSAIVGIKNNPKVEGVIVVAKGVESLEMKQKISNALASLLGIASYKVQVFEK